MAHQEVPGIAAFAAAPASRSVKPEAADDHEDVSILGINGNPVPGTFLPVIQEKPGMAGGRKKAGFLQHKGSAAGTSGRMLTDERIPLPEGIVAPTYLYDGPLNHFNDPKEVMGFEDTVSVTIPVESMEHHYYSMLRKIERLAKNRMSAGSDENRTHYRLLVYKISQSLK